MKKILAIILGTALAGGMAIAQGTQDQSDYGDEMEPSPETDQSEYGDDTDPMSDPEDPTEVEDEPTTITAHPNYTEETSEMSTLADMSVDELEGKALVTYSGEEIGTIDNVGHIDQHQERVVTVDVGGFLGLSEKTIAIPLSELAFSAADGNILTTLNKEAIESSEEVDEQNFTEEKGSSDTGY